jgi:molecular chaperone DnaK
VPQIEVSFDLDANGILTVTAKDKATGKSQAIKITGSTGLTKDEIEKMREEAEKNADKDKEEKDKIEVRNKADNMIYVSEKSLRDAGDKVDKTVKENVEKKIKELKEKIEKGTKDEIESKTKDLSDELSKIGQAAYAKQEAKPGEQAGPKNEQPKEETKKDEKGKKVEEGEVVN